MAFTYFACHTKADAPKIAAFLFCNSLGSTFTLFLKVTSIFSSIYHLIGSKIRLPAFAKPPKIKIASPYFFDPANLEVPVGAQVVVETSKGLELCECVQSNHTVTDERIVPPLRRVVRIATPDDLRIAELCKKREKEAFGIAEKKIAEHGLDMKLVDVECNFEGNKMLFFFTSDGRVDFRELVKDLAGEFRTRIELRQIGVRDEAKMLGGIGPCGRPICCRTYLGDFTPVSIKMAKEQNLSLNPTKISGLCDRLMCCLKYEQDHYETTRKRMPRVGREIITPDGPGTINAINVLSETVRVRIAVGDAFELREYSIDDCQRPNQEAQPQGGEHTPKKERAPKPERAEKPEKPEKPEDADKPEAIEKQEKPEKPERQEKADRPERAEKPRRADKPERFPKGHKGDKPERTDKPERAEKPERTDKPERAEKPERTDKPERAGKPERADKGDRQPRAEKGERPQKPQHDKKPRREQSAPADVKNAPVQTEAKAVQMKDEKPAAKSMAPGEEAVQICESSALEDLL